MAIHKLQINDFVSTDYELIAIHSTVEDYRIAFFLNKEIGLQLKKNKIPIELKQKNGTSSFEHFVFEDEKNDVFWHLVSNKSELIANQTNKVGFFEKITSASFLLPEVKSADYILKIENVDAIFDIDNILKELKKIPYISLVHTIEKEKLKSKNNLIF